mmetsp:Transcript_33797/g.75575  ORF Transcript_33797/g.75575 Transcript_33797/m.75575 type:complete len:360 (+) Transcript_33797:694-1773(+)
MTQLVEGLRACQVACERLQEGQQENGRLHAMVDRDVHRLKGILEQRHTMLAGQIEELSHSAEHASRQIRERESALAANLKSQSDFDADLAAVVQQAQAASQLAEKAHSEAQRALQAFGDSQREADVTKHNAIALTDRVVRLEKSLEESATECRARITRVLSDLEAVSNAAEGRAQAERELRAIVEDIDGRLIAQRSDLETVQTTLSSVELFGGELAQQVDWSKNQTTVTEMLRQRVDELQEQVGEQVSIWRKGQERLAQLTAAHKREDLSQPDVAVGTPRSPAVDGAVRSSHAPEERIHPALDMRRISFAPGVAPSMRSEIRRESRASAAGGAVSAGSETAGRRKTISSVAMRLSGGQS